MPPRFLTDKDREQLNNFPLTVEESELITHFFLSPTDHEQVAFQRGDAHRLGFALLLCALRYIGFFPLDVQTAPPHVVLYLAEQLGCYPAALMEYGKRVQTRREHQQEVMAYLEFRWLQEHDEDALLVWLTQRALENERPSALLQQATERLYKQRIVRPGITTLERLVTTARRQAGKETYRRLSTSLDKAARQKLDTLLQPDPTSGETPLIWLRRPARGYSADDILESIAKLVMTQTWEINTWHLAHIPPARLQHLAQIARHSSNQALQRRAAYQRYPILMAFLVDAREKLTDEILDLYDNRIAQGQRDAKIDFRDYRLQRSEALQQQVGYFSRIVAVILDEEIADAALRSNIFDIIPRSHLVQLSANIEAQQQMLDERHFFGNRYSYFRRFFPRLIKTLKFHPLQAPDSLVDALTVLRQMNESHEPDKLLEDAPRDFVPDDWRRRVFNPDRSINRRWYELCVINELRDALRSGRIWVENSQRYTNLENYLIPKDRWEDLRSVYLDLVNGTNDADQRLSQLQIQLEEAFQQLDQQLPNDNDLRMEGDRIILTRFEGEGEETSLSDQIQSMLPHLQLAELLHEVDSWTKFSDRFEHATGNTPRIKNLNCHLYAVLLSQARNIDFYQMVDVVDLSYSQLLWTNNWYVREETLQAATNDLVNYQYSRPLSHYWGDGRFSSSDGQRFAVAVRTQNATPLPRYFGFGRGLTFLTWTSNQYSQYATLVTPPTHGEAAYTLDKILDNETELDIKEHTTDTGGYTDLIFALFDLLGMQFAPRLKDISDTRLYCIDSKKTYQHIQPIITRKINLHLIRQHWDDMLRVAGSLKLKWVTASLLIRKLQAFPRQHVLTRALQEYGRLVKTLFILHYFHSEAYRRRIGAQLNKGEKLHTLRASLHSANRGLIRKKYPDEHINQANCLNLITNAITVWNTVYMQLAIDHLRGRGQEITQADLGSLSPARFEHINIHGKYSFDISVPLTNGGLRPLVGLT
jgi:TnpA family transposase